MKVAGLTGKCNTSAMDKDEHAAELKGYQSLNWKAKQLHQLSGEVFDTVLEKYTEDEKAEASAYMFSINQHIDKLDVPQRLTETLYTALLASAAKAFHGHTSEAVAALKDCDPNQTTLPTNPDERETKTSTDPES